MGRLFRSLGSLADRILCVIAAVIFLQAPIYMNQYENVLAGAQKESSISFLRLTDIAGSFGQSLEEYLDELVANENPKVTANAQEDKERLDRYIRYTEAQMAFEQANAFTRPFVFMKWYDPALGEAVVFQPGLPLTIEGFMYALAGLLLIMGLISLVKWLLGARQKDKIAA